MISKLRNQNLDASRFVRSTKKTLLVTSSIFLLAVTAMAQTVTLIPTNGIRVFVGAGSTFGAAYTNTQIRALLSGDFSTTPNPVTLAAPTAPAWLTVGFATNNFTNSQTVFIPLAVTNAPLGTHTLTIEASTNSVLLYSTNITIIAGKVWTNSDPANINWSTAANWSTGSSPGGGDDVMFQDAGVGAGAATNFVDVSTTVGSLSFIRNISGSNHKVSLGSNVTLRVDGSKGLLANVDSFRGNNKTMVLNFFGTNASVVVSNTSAVFALNGMNSGGTGTTLNMTNLGRFEATVDRFGVGDATFAAQGGVGPQMVRLDFARTNYIKAGFGGVNFSLANTNYIPYGVSFFYNYDADNNGSAYTVNLGLTNVILADSIGQSQSRNGSGSTLVRFNPVFTNQSPGLYIRNTNGGRVTLMAAGVDAGPTLTGSNTKGQWDFRNGSVNLLVETMWLGRNRVTNSSAANPIGLLLFDNGTVNVNTLIAGYQAYVNDSFVNSTITVGGSAKPATLVVNSNLVLGFTSGDYSAGANVFKCNGQIVINTNGLVRANQITVGTLSSNNTITINNGGILEVSNTVASLAKGLQTMTMNGASGAGAGIGLHIIGTNTVIYTTNLTTTAAGNVLNILSVSGISSYPVTIPVITYVNGVTAAISAGSTAAAGIPGLHALVDNDGLGRINLTLNTNVPKTLVWKGTVNNQWNTTTKNWLDVNTALTTNFVTGDNVIFDDTASQFTVNVTENVIPGQSPGVDGITMTNNTQSYTMAGAAQLVGSATFAKNGTNSLLVNGSMEATLKVQQGTATVSGTGTIGAGIVSLGANLILQVGATCTASVTSAGVVNNAGTINAGVTVQATGAVTNTGTTYGTLAMSAGGVLNNSTTMNTIGSPTIPSGATIVNGGILLGNALNMGGTFIDLGTGYVGMVGTFTLTGTGTFLPGGTGTGTTIVKETSIVDPISAGTMRLDNGSVTIFKVDPGTTNNTKLLSNLQLLGPSQSTPQTNGGTIVITNISATPFAIGQEFKLFGSQPTNGTFSPSLFSLNTTNAYPVMSPAQPASGMAWDLGRVIFEGIISITNGPVILPTSPTNITFSASGGVLNMSWPADYTGWLLQTQTNALAVGLTPATNTWFNVSGSDATNSVAISIDPTQPTVFYRLVYP